jgi:RNA polymerase sigma factor (sigma-70 family)
MVESALSSDYRIVESAGRAEPSHRADPPDDWAGITLRMSRGDQDAFRLYYDQYFDLMVAESRRCLGRDEQTCLDIVHDAMLKAIRARRPLANQQNTAAWTRLLVRSVAYDWLRKRKRRRELTRDAMAEFAREPRDEPATAPTLDDAARLVWIEEQLRRLPSDVQRIIDWRYRLGWTLQRIGRQLGLKPGAVDGKLRRAVDELKSMAEQWCDD